MIRYKAFKDYWGTKPKIDNLVFSITKDPAVRLAKLRANECQVISFPNVADLPVDQGRQDPAAAGAAGPEHRLSGLQHPEEAVRRQARAPGAQHGDRQEGDPRRGLSGRRPAGEEPDPADHLGLQQQRRRTIKFDPADAKKLLAEAGYPERVRDRPVGDAGAAPLQSRRQAHRRTDAVGPRQGRHQGQDRQLRMGRIPQARPGTASIRRPSSAGPATMAIRTISSSRWPAVPRPVRAAPARPNGATRTSTTLINKAATITDQAERTKLYQQAQVIMHDEAPFFLIAHSVVFMPMRANVTGYVMSPFGSISSTRRPEVARPIERTVLTRRVAAVLPHPCRDRPCSNSSSDASA